MALRPAPSFVGQITISTSNNKLYWKEFPSGTKFSCTLSSGDYYPEELAVEMETQINATASIVNTYEVFWDLLTGKFSITSDADFLIICLSSDSSKAWSGGDTDTSGTTLNDGQVAKNHLGFPIDDLGSVYTQGVSFEAPAAAFAYWMPTFPPNSDNEERFESVVSESIAMDGTSQVYDYTGSKIDADYYPDNFQYLEYRDLSFDLVDQDSRFQFLKNFWLSYAKQGKIFRYYQNPVSGSTHRVYRLTGESLRGSTFLERRPALPRWSGSLALKREVDDYSTEATYLTDSLSTETMDGSYTQANLYRTITENTTLTITGQKVGNKIILFADALDVSDSITFPSGVTIGSGSPDYTLGRINKIELTCTNKGLKKHSGVITNLAADTGIHTVFPMEETSGTVLASQAFDHVASYNSGTLHGSITRQNSVSAPKIFGGKCYDFSGTAYGGVKLTTSVLSGDKTFVFCVDYDTLTSGYFLYVRPYPYVNFYNIFACFANGSGNIVFSHTDATNTTRSITSADVFSTGTKLMIVVRWTAAGSAIMDVNNSQQASGSIGVLSAVSREYWLGVNPSGGTDPFNGRWYRHEIFDGILSDTEVDFLWNDNRGNTLANVLAS